jgi:hypothetical protein
LEGGEVDSGLMKMGQFVEEQHSTIPTDYSIRAAEKGVVVFFYKMACR